MFNFRKSLSVAGLAALAFTSLSVAAKPGDMFEIKAGYDYWLSSTKADGQTAGGTQNQSSYYVGFEHFVPLLPNAKLRYTDVSSNPLAMSFSQMDVIGYYRLLDSNLIGLDIGLNMQQFRNGQLDTRQFDFWHPALYGDLEVNLPVLPIAIYSTVSAGNFGDNKTMDAEIGAKWIVEMGPLDLGLKAGYRAIDHSIETSQAGTPAQQQRIKLDGAYFGAELKF
ncbi:TIGR04219 family outer membrane beta-barrel protein [Vibrio sp.]|uniref:TIGR04219 family outer membrane beta-barrel protein n=1 Tax=Vibrio sp. TaxID=678 RepID=UPI003D0C1AC6